MENKRSAPSCIGIVGLGLIGGSLGLDLQALGYEVHGLVHRSSTAHKAQDRKLAQVISIDTKILSDCELIILALPLDQLLKPSDYLLSALPKSAVITDVGSVKAPVVKVWRELHQNFVGSHPMAGRNDSGVEAGIKGLFNKRPWVTTPEEKTNQNALAMVGQLAVQLGAQLIEADPNLHDQAVALISHLPVLVSAALLRTLSKEENPTIIKLAQQLASSGFADTTRVGGGNPNLGLAMVRNNKSAIVRALRSYNNNLHEYEKNILDENWAQFQTELEQTKELRPGFLKDDD